jgi:acyl-ACP thioesterase
MQNFAPPQYWVDSYKVYSYHADAQQQLSLTAMLHFLQETAYNHASANGFGYDDLNRSGLFWVLSRLTLRVLRYPMWNENLTLRTWSKQPSPLTGNRDFELIDAQGNTVAAATTMWLMLDAVTHRPQRVARFGTDFPHVLDRHAIADTPEKIPAFSPTSSPDFTSAPHDIAPSDIDLNGHVNNACYVRWVLDCVPPSVVDGKNIAQLEVNFLHESQTGQHYVVATQANADNTFTANVTRCDDGKELIRMRATLLNLKF